MTPGNSWEFLAYHSWDKTWKMKTHFTRTVLGNPRNSCPQKNPRISEEKSWDILGLNLRNFSGFPRISHDNSAQVSLLILSFQKTKTNPINIAVS